MTGNSEHRGPSDTLTAEAVLIGAGIMSATLASILAILQPDWRVVIVERRESPAAESSDPWNNAGTGHAGYCELNYMPDPTDSAKATDISRRFHISRQWWAHLVRERGLHPASFIHDAPHMNVVFGTDGVDYLRRRYETLVNDPFFADMEFSDDPATLARWAPLVMAERLRQGLTIGATRHPFGTDVDFGALTRDLLDAATPSASVRYAHDVRGLRRAPDGRWVVSGRAVDSRFEIRTQHVFVGAGGMALRLLQRARLPEVRGHGVLPVGASFLRCSDPAVVAHHDSKVYGQAAAGAPPMSVPHLDKRVVNGTESLMFGPYATFSTRLLVHGHLTDYFTTVRPHNVGTMASALWRERNLVRYLVGELTASRTRKFAQLRDFFPSARPEDWHEHPAGQRAQIVSPGNHGGELRQGTELVVSSDRSISGLLGASPGASTAVDTMLDLLRRSFPDRWDAEWGAVISDCVPGYGYTRDQWTTDQVRASFRTTGEALDLARPRTSGNT